MGMFGFLFFGEDDAVLVEEIAKKHKLPKEVVEKHYKKMLEEMKKDVLQEKA